MNWTDAFGGAQSALVEAGRNATIINDLTISMTIVLSAAFLITLIALAFAWFKQGGGSWIIWSGGIVFPLVALIGLSAAATLSGRALIALRTPDALIVDIIGHQYWWDVRYPETGEEAAIRTANELHIPVDTPILLRLQTADVIHSFWVPSLAGKLDMIPGRVNELAVLAERTGIYRGQCAEFCGQQHSRMALDVQVHAQQEFTSWRRDLADGARDPLTPQQRLGQRVFVEAGCPACHVIAGVSESGHRGPDLTNVGARRTLGAGMWPNNRGMIAGWIAGVQTMKPGAHMPNFDGLSGRELRAVAAYLENLR